MKHLNQTEKNVYGIYIIGVFGLVVVGILHTLQNMML